MDSVVVGSKQGGHPIPDADYEKMNAIVLQWVPLVRSQLVSSARQLSHGKNVSFVTRGNRVEKKLSESISMTTRRDFGVINTIRISFERHGVFVHKGVGRKYPISGKQDVENPSGKTRKPVDWFNDVLNTNMPELSNKLAEINADFLVNSYLMTLK